MSRDRGPFLAFVSYRHRPHDRACAQRLHETLETAPLPRAAEVATRRVFRDEEELRAAPSLGDEIRTALDASGWLVVVCSPETPDSAWVADEIALFLSSRPPTRVVAVLADGTPDTSVPAPLRDAPGLTTVDARPSAGESAADALRRAALETLAHVAGLPADEVIELHDAARMRRRLVVGACATVVAAGLALLAADAAAAARQATRARDAADAAAATALRERETAVEVVAAVYDAALDARRRAGDRDAARATLTRAVLAHVERLLASPVPGAAGAPAAAARALRLRGDIAAVTGDTRSARASYEAARDAAAAGPDDRDTAREWAAAALRVADLDLRVTALQTVADVSGSDAGDPDADGGTTHHGGPLLRAHWTFAVDAEAVFPIERLEAARRVCGEIVRRLSAHAAEDATRIELDLAFVEAHDAELAYHLGDAEGCRAAAAAAGARLAALAARPLGDAERYEADVIAARNDFVRGWVEFCVGDADAAARLLDDAHTRAERVSDELDRRLGRDARLEARLDEDQLAALASAFRRFGGKDGRDAAGRRLDPTTEAAIDRGVGAHRARQDALRRAWHRQLGAAFFGQPAYWEPWRASADFTPLRAPTADDARRRRRAAERLVTPTVRAGGDAWGGRPPRWRLRSAWEGLRAGDGAERVRELLGEPHEREERPGVGWVPGDRSDTIWRYQQLGAHVVLGDDGRVVRWQPPVVLVER